MPNYYAHLQFGGRVLRSLPEPLARLLKGERTAFDIGCYGPDPLFFYRPVKDNPVRRLGLGMHKEPVRPMAERLLLAVEENRPQARGYAAGFLCHFALDSACHAYIEERSAVGPATHSGMEAEFDRLLMERSGVDPLRETPMPGGEPPVLLLGTIASVYPGLTPDQFRAGLAMFRRVSRLQTLAAGTGLRRAVDAVSRRTAGKPDFRGVVLDRVPQAECAVSNTILDQLLEGAVAPAAAEITGFFRTAAKGGPLSDWFDRDFSGRTHTVPDAASY